MAHKQSTLFTKSQHRVISAIISYDDPQDAAAALGISYGHLRNVLIQARRRVGVGNTPQLVHKWTLDQARQQLGDL